MFPKHQYVRSKRLMEAYRRIPCQHCGVDDGSVAGAHSNWGWGRGKSIKADDNRCASLCFNCHRELDMGKNWTREQRKAIWTAAHQKTVALLNKLGLWPAGVPQP